MANRDALIEEVLLNLAGFISDQELIGTLHADVTANATSFTVDGSVFTDASASGFQPGLIEVGNELCYVGAVNPSTGAFSNVVRGFRGTTGFAWGAGTQVRDHPRVPKVAVVKAMNHAIDALFPAVFVAGSSEVTAAAGQTGYDLPATVESVLAVRWQGPASTGAWVEPLAWRFDKKAPSTSQTGRMLTVSGVPTGQKIQAVTAAKPTALFTATTGANDESFTTVTGLPAWTEELIVMGACYRLVGFLDAGRVAERTAESDLLAQQSPTGAAADLSKYFYGLYTDLLERARIRMLTEAMGADALRVSAPQQQPQQQQGGQ